MPAALFVPHLNWGWCWQVVPWAEPTGCGGLVSLTSSSPHLLFSGIRRQLLLARSLSATSVLIWAGHGQQSSHGSIRPPSEVVRVQAFAGLGGVRFCAPPLLALKFSPDGPSATVLVIGCSFPENLTCLWLTSHPLGPRRVMWGMLNERGAASPKRVSSLSPWLSMAPWLPHPAPALKFPHQPVGPWLWSHVLGNPGFYYRESPA